MPRLAWRLLFALLLNFCAVSWSMAADWQVVRVTGSVWVVKADMAPIRATAGMVLPDDATIETMPRARAMLRHGEDLLNVGPDTQIAPQARRVHGLTTVLMREGKVDLDIEPLGAPHFAVQTPVLAAVVKGTRFTVTVTRGNGAVSVRRGRVAVTAFAARRGVEVTSGQTATVVHQSLQLSGSGTLSPIESVTTSTPMVEAAVDAESAASASGESTVSASSASAKAKSATKAASAASNSNAGGNSAAHASANSNAGGNSANSNAGGNSSNSNAGGNSSAHANPNSNAGGKKNN